MRPYERQLMDYEFDFLKLTIKDMERFFARGETDMLAQAELVYKTLCKRPKGWDSPQAIIDESSYIQFSQVKSQCLQEMNEVPKTIDPSEFVQWDINKPKTRDIQDYLEANKRGNHQRCIEILHPFLESYPESWGDLSDPDDYIDKLPFFVSKLLYSSLNRAILEHQKK